MEVLQNVILGFSVALTPENLAFCFAGVFIGTLVGVLPGIGPVSAIAMLLPITFNMNPTSSLIMLAGLYYGTMYGGSTTSILLNIPGESMSVITCLDGYQMARQGRAGKALGIAAVSSFIAGTFGILGLMLLAPVLSVVALSFGPPEYFTLMLFGLTTLATLSGSGSFIKALLSGGFGLALGTIGAEPLSGYIRFTYGSADLHTGLSFVPVTVGLFAIAEVLTNSETLIKREVAKTKLSGLFLSLQDLKDCAGTFVRSTLVGFSAGVVPGSGPTLASFLAYAVEKRFSKNSAQFGKGAIQGVAAPEGANNAACAAALVPMLSLGIPGSVTTAIMLGALMMWGLRPGPLLWEKNPDLVWGVIASLYIGNVVLLILNLPLVGMWASLLRVRYSIMMPLILAFCFIGTYSVNNSLFDIGVMIVFGVLGYFMQKFRFPAAPMTLALVLGPMLEMALSQSMTMSKGDASIFFQRPIALTFLVVMVLFVSSSLARPLFFRLRKGGEARAKPA